MPVGAQERNVAPRRGAAVFWTYMAAVGLGGIGLMLAVVWRLSAVRLADMGAAFVVVTLLLVLGELRPLYTAGARDVNGVTTSTAFVFAMLLHWGLGVALVAQTIATIIAAVAQRRAPWRTAFNVGQYALSLSGASVVLSALGAAGSPAHPATIAGHDLPVVALAAVTYFVLNESFVSRAVSLRSGTTFFSVLTDGLAYAVAANGALLALSPMIVVVVQQGVALVPLILLPLWAVHATAAMSLEKERQALHDALTGLPNRKLFVRHAHTAIADCIRDDASVALCLLDLDRFKEVNDTLGHQTGDALLELVSRRLEGALRPGDTVARLGGDEFALLVTGIPHVSAARDIAERVRDALADPFRHDGMSFELEASVGVAMFPGHGDDVETLMQRADVAMYVAKERRTGVEVYSPSNDRHSHVRLGMTAELRDAMDRGELELHYQPKADLRTGDVVGVEALVRWRHPEHGLVMPDEFIPVAEQTGLMRRLTRVIVEDALAQGGAWWRAGLQVQIAVNVSARDLYDPRFAEFLQSRLDEHGVHAGALQIEVTESVIMADVTRAATTLRVLAGLGVGISLDDFGTGYSSLVHLKRLPVTEIKIDRSFVARMAVDDDDATIVRSIVELGSSLGRRVVAEGVETRETWDRLAAYGCDAAQGFYLARPMPAEQMTAWLEAARVSAGPRLAVVPSAAPGLGA